MFAAALSAISALSQGPDAAAAPPVPTVDNSVVNIAPVGVNLGEIIQPYTQGSATNGGSGLQLPSRYTPQAVNTGVAGLTIPNPPSDTSSYIMIGGVALVVGGLVFLVARRRN